ncbi:MAG: prolipoprotein diacylglyceryl transferase [Gammaproteobacteria bacterium]|nr:MAG: prolipoprotein diacylglyceryl transferase [Gammaproteobacteria bacterium]
MEFPIIDPDMFSIGPIELFGMSIGPIALKWYGFMYMLGLLAAWWLGNLRSKSATNSWNKEQVGDMIFYGFLGVVLGGRVGYVLFYHMDLFLANPIYLFKIHEGGMSFHGGLLGVLTAFFYFGRKTGKSFFEISDFFAPFAPIGLGLGRIGNFINAELWGRVAGPDVPWAMRFPTDPDYLLRHPSQLYQFLLEGVLLFILLFWFSSKPRPRMAVSGLFFMGYGIQRFIIEYFRQPDAHLGLLWFKLSMGQLLSLPMVIVGILIIWKAYQKPLIQS